ncbi:uncharacterized protein [Bemisia tabaci]|uniref:uncharacterized protein n=1 Tax=Bemisia tabaci TaxID=7038 RepID=UPI003B27F173
MCLLSSLQAQTSAIHVKNGVSVCIFNSTTQIIDGGHKEDLLFASTFQEDPVTATLDKSGWKTIINIDCNKDAGILSSLAVSHYDISTNTVTMDLKSNDVCIGFNATSGYGFFSSLLMVILLGFTIYFVGGAILLKFLRGADGLEMIPNYEFWQNFPQLCKNWFNKLRGQDRPETYENI